MCRLIFWRVPPPIRNLTWMKGSGNFEQILTVFEWLIEALLHSSECGGAAKNLAITTNTK
ncbi:MAG: hypothetical protein Hens2KO_09860 [Henriciella sp.]